MNQFVSGVQGCLLLLFVAATIAGAPTSFGQTSGVVEEGAAPSGIIWGALVRASQQEISAPEGTSDASQHLSEDMVEQLKKSFPYRHYLILGRHTQPVHPEYETWIVPSEEMYMKVDSKGPVEGGLGLHLQLWRKKNVIVKSDVVLSPDSPVVVAGPEWGDDRLLFLLVLEE